MADPLLGSLVERLIGLALQATNGWAVYAKRKIEHDDIARLHREIDEAREAASRLADGTRGAQIIEIDEHGTVSHTDETALSTPPASPAATSADDIAMGLLQEVIDKSEPRKPGGQQVGTQRYQMTPSTRQELQRILRHWKDARISAAERPAPTCQWTEDDDGVWHTDCGEAWQFTTDGPIENRQRYCGYCGKSLSAAPRSVVAPEE